MGWYSKEDMSKVLHWNPTLDTPIFCSQEGAVICLLLSMHANGKYQPLSNGYIVELSQTFTNLQFAFILKWIGWNIKS